ncbi:MAG: hypothetical protein ACFFBP_01380 [Promethearchaeota archaeon]
MPRYVELTCPACQTFKKISVPDAVFEQNNFGTIKIQVPFGAVCPDHQFIAFVDIKGIVRGYERIDLLMKMPLKEEEYSELEKTPELTINKIINSFGLYGVFCLFHAKIFNYPVYIIKNDNGTDDSTALNQLLDNILPEKYKDLTHPIIFINKNEFDKLKQKKKRLSLMIDPQQKIYQTPWSEKLKFEESILQKALEMIDLKEQLFIIKQEIARFIIEAEEVKIIVGDAKEIYKKELIETLSVNLNSPRINMSRLTLLLNFIDQRFSRRISRKIKTKVEEFLNFL